jgi:hypothetical protein
VSGGSRLRRSPPDRPCARSHAPKAACWRRSRARGCARTPDNATRRRLPPRAPCRVRFCLDMELAATLPTPAAARRQRLERRFPARPAVARAAMAAPPPRGAGGGVGGLGRPTAHGRSGLAGYCTRLARQPLEAWDNGARGPCGGGVFALGWPLPGLLPPHMHDYSPCWRARGHARSLVRGAPTNCGAGAAGGHPETAVLL